MGLGSLFKSTSKQKTTTDQSQSGETGLNPIFLPHVKRAMSQAANISQQGAGLPNQLVAGLDKNTEAGLNANRQGAAAIAPILEQQQRGLSDTLSGKYTDPTSNPFFQGVADLVRSQVTPAVDSRFGAAGAFGSPLHQIGLSQGITRELAPHLFSAYQQERGFQNQAINNADAIAGRSATTRGNILQDIGNVYQGQNQAELDAARYRAEADRAARLEGSSNYQDALARIGQFFRTEKNEASSSSKTKGKQNPGFGNQLINLGGQIGAKFASGGAA